MIDTLQCHRLTKSIQWMMLHITDFNYINDSMSIAL